MIGNGVSKVFLFFSLGFMDGVLKSEHFLLDQALFSCSRVSYICIRLFTC